MTSHVVSKAIDEHTGFISYEAFESALKQLAERWQSVDSNNMSIRLNGEPNTHYLTISHPLSNPSQPPTQTKRTSTPPLEDIEILSNSSITSSEDEAAIIHQPPTTTTRTIDYTILHSPTYRVPVLYFHLKNNLPPSSSSSTAQTALDFIYDHLVPPHQQESLRNVGILGGVGMTNHPITDIPCFWVHPCNTAAAMAELLVPKRRSVQPKLRRKVDDSSGGEGGLEYLMLWFGLVGGAVGLNLPREVAVSLTS